VVKEWPQTKTFMSHFWLANASGGWGIHSLAGESCLAASAGPNASFSPPAAGPGLDEIRIVPPDAAGGSAAWALLAGLEVSVRVNGLPLVLGIHALRDRDEISLAGQRYFFSTEELALVTPFPGLAQPACCPRCKQKVEVGEPAVACPHCRAWHHQSDEFPCWTYEPTCALCQLQSTALDAGYSWTPDTL
jgi:hypothetical protein